MEFGAGMFLFEPVKLAVVESLLPRGNTQFGPPLCAFKLAQLVNGGSSNLKLTETLLLNWLTSTVEPLADRARMSAQETV